MLSSPPQVPKAISPRSRPCPYAVAALFFLIPFDLGASQGLHWMLSASVGSLYLLCTPSALASILVWTVPCIRRAVPLPLACWMGSGLATLCAGIVAGGIYFEFALWDALLGFVLPSLLVLGICSARSPHVLIKSFCHGFLWYLAIGFGVLIWSVRSLVQSGAPWAALDAFDMVRFFRYEMMEPVNLYALWMGNANKAANVIFLVTAVVAGLEVANATIFRTRSTRLMFVLLTTVHVVATSSRLILVLFPLLQFIWWVSGTKLRGRVGLLQLLPPAVGLLAILSLGPFLYRTFFVNEQGGLFSTFAAPDGRLDQWEHALTLFGSDPLRVITGFGSGWYGVTVFGYPEAETHNFILDRLLSAGVLGVGLAICALLVSIVQIRAMPGRARLIAYVGMVGLLLCWLREFNPAYLFRTSLAGVVCCIMLSLPQLSSSARNRP